MPRAPRPEPAEHRTAGRNIVSTILVEDRLRITRCCRPIPTPNARWRALYAPAGARVPALAALLALDATLAQIVRDDARTDGRADAADLVARCADRARYRAAARRTGAAARWRPSAAGRGRFAGDDGRGMGGAARSRPRTMPRWSGTRRGAGAGCSRRRRGCWGRMRRIGWREAGQGVGARRPGPARIEPHAVRAGRIAR